MVLKHFDLELKDGTQVTASVDFYIEAYNENEAIGHIEYIEVAGQDYTDADFTKDSLAELQYEIDEIANENAHEFWYENQAAEAYDSWKDSRYDD